ncbi:NAD(P)-dependent oxidoreductase [uncultured Nonlabens sp.]|uniref:NAD(P)/FAD-dependent oxidoreductase n=1 Tax=uncultured Nonlabens sp. TaxID=859306 RepID=UPI00262ABBFE|nr:NAD(P)-dependent oxidoreductase [uncultured Nonlabens sp.]
MKKSVAIIGSGPSAFLLAAFLDQEKFSITIYEKNKTSGRKFLVAGKGGFNLTHSESIENLVNKYTPKDFLSAALLNFTNQDFRNWLQQIGIPTFVGSSKRVYPVKGIKPIKVLNSIMNHLKQKGVEFKHEHIFSGWDVNNNPIINNHKIEYDYTVFALGGASWSVTGSNGDWLITFNNKSIKTKSFQASNCGYHIKWKSKFIELNEGEPLKNIAICCNDVVQKGEAVITKFGLEGNAIYGLSPQIRQQLITNSTATIFIDFKPSLSIEKVISKIKLSSHKTIKDILKKELKLSISQIDLLKYYLKKDSYLNTNTLANYIKRFPLNVVATASIEESISTVGGIDKKSLTANYELKNLPNQYCIGEMIDWDAPTGGYLLQACTSTGVFLAKHLNQINEVH